MKNTQKVWRIKRGRTCKNITQIFKLKEEIDTTKLFEKIETIQLQARKITDDTILEKEICSEIITVAPKMYMPVIRNLQKENGSNL